MIINVCSVIKGEKMKAIPVPPVCTANWNGSSWATYFAMNAVETEPQTINSSFGIWEKTGEVDEKGNALYSLKK